MARSVRQIEADARLTREAISQAGKPLRVTELAEYIRLQGRPQSEKQARMTVEHAERLGILCRSGNRWDAAPTSPPSVESSAPGALDEIHAILSCARTLLDFPLSEHTRRVLRDLLERAEDALSRQHEARTIAPTPDDHVPGNGTARHDDPEIEVLLSAHT